MQNAERKQPKLFLSMRIICQWGLDWTRERGRLEPCKTCVLHCKHGSLTSHTHNVTHFLNKRGSGVALCESTTYGQRRYNTSSCYIRPTARYVHRSPLHCEAALCRESRVRSHNANMRGVGITFETTIDEIYISMVHNEKSLGLHRLP